MTKKVGVERSYAHSPPPVSGPAAAALISALLGCFLMMVSHHIGDTSQAAAEFLWKIGSWIPGSEMFNKSPGEIDSYYGKETVLLVSWLVSWSGLHQLWKNKQIPFSWIFWSFSLLVAATVMAWHPLFPYLKIM
jgi:hypothetical protein